VNDLAFRILFIAERNDRRLAAARVRAELRVQVRRRERPELSRLFASFDRVRPSSVFRSRSIAASLASAFVSRASRCFRERSAKIRSRDVARDRTLKADFFAGALALVRRATTAVSILRDVARFGAAATRTPVNVDASMVSVGVC
jgi:hypothetical protein